MSQTTYQKFFLSDEDDEIILLANEIPVKPETNSKNIAIEKLIPIKLSKGEVLHNKKIAFIKKKDQKNSSMKNDIEDLFWSVTLWPSFILSTLLSKKFGYNDRICLAAFFFGNGLQNPKFASKILKFYNPNYRNVQEWNLRLNKFELLFSYLAKSNQINDPQYNHIRSTYYFYSMIQNRLMYFNGDLCRYDTYNYNINSNK